MRFEGRHPLSWRWQQIWAVVGVPLLMVQLLSLASWLNPYSKQVGDLSQDYLSARSYYDGHSIYESMDESMPRYLGIENATQRNRLVINAHPPQSVILALPFGMLEYPYAKLLWNVLSLLTVAASAYAIVSRFGLDLDSSNVWPLIVLIVCSGPLSSQIQMAQFNAFLVGLLTFAWLAQRNRQSALAGVLVGVAASIKLFPLFILFVFFCMRDWKAVISGVLTIVAVVAIAALLFGVDSFRVYVTQAMPEVANWRGAWLNSSLTGFWSRLFDPGSYLVQPAYQSATLAKVCIALSSLVVVAFVAWQAWRSRDVPTRDIAYSTAVIAMMLLSPTTWDHYYVILLLPLAVLWWQGLWSRISRALFAFCVFILVVLRPSWIWSGLLMPLPNEAAGILNPSSPIRSLLVLAIPTYTLILLLALSFTRVPADDAQSCVD